MSTSRLLEFTPNNQAQQKCITVDVYRDNNVEGTEQFRVKLETNETNVYLEPNLTSIAIIDNNG